MSALPDMKGAELAKAVAMRAEGLGKAYGAITVLSDVTLDIVAGEVHAIIGENGAGKSTLMKLLSGHVLPTAALREGAARCVVRAGVLPERDHLGI